MPRSPLSLLLAGSVSLAAACSSAQTTSVAAVPDSVRVARVLNGLRPQVEVEGRPLQTWSLAERMAHYKAPGVSIAIIDGGRIVWAKGFGVKEAGTTDSVTPETLFQAASISKPVTATAMLRLVAQGGVALDSNVNIYLKSWKVPDNRFTTTEKVTLRRIASHSAGLTVHGFPGYAEGAPLPTVVQVLNGEKPANTPPVRVDTTPGAIWRYAGGGTTVEQLLLTEVTGESFPALMKRLVLDPAGMSLSTYEQPLPEARWPEAARAHGGDGSVVKGRWHTYPEMGAAGLWTTPSDLARWALAIAAARAGKDSSLLPPALVGEMLTVQKGSFGIGPALNGTGRSFRFGHGGSNEGFRSDLEYYPELGIGAAIMVNSDNGDQLMSEVMFAIAAEYGLPDYAPKKVKPIAMDSAGLAKAVGEYVLQFGGQKFPLSIKLENGKLISIIAISPTPEELVPVDSNVFVGTSRGFRFEVAGDSIAIKAGDDNVVVRGKRKSH